MMTRILPSRLDMDRGIVALETHSIWVVLVALLRPVFVRKHGNFAKGAEKPLQLYMPMPGSGSVRFLSGVSLAYDVSLYVCMYVSIYGVEQMNSARSPWTGADSKCTASQGRQQRKSVSRRHM